MGVAIWVTNPWVFLLRCVLPLSDAFSGQHLSRDALWQWHSHLPLKRRRGASQKTQPLQTARFREKGAQGRVVVHLSFLIWCKVGNTRHEVITILITTFHVLVAVRCCQDDAKPFPYPGARPSVGRESPSFHSQGEMG